MADRDPPRTPPETRRPVAGEPGYRDPRTTTTTTTTTSRRSGGSWIGIIVALIVIGVLAAWWAGAFRGGNETAMMAGDRAVTESPAPAGDVGAVDGGVGAPTETAPGAMPPEPAPGEPAGPAAQP